MPPGETHLALVNSGTALIGMLIEIPVSKNMIIPLRLAGVFELKSGGPTGI